MSTPLHFDADYREEATLADGTPVLLYAMGDGNHSLATAKTIWEKTRNAAPDKAAVLKSPLRHTRQSR